MCHALTYGTSATREMKTVKTTTIRLHPEDLVLTVLCTGTGPALWTAGLSLQEDTGAAGPVRQIETWLASGLAVLGIAVAAWWAVALCGAVATVIGVKLDRRALQRWGQTISPQFLGRVAAVTLGAQIITAPGAWAAPSGPGLAVDAPTSGASSWQEPPTPRWTQLPQPQWSAASTPTSSVLAGGHRSATPQSATAPVPTPDWLPRSPSPSAPERAGRALQDAPTVTVRQGDCLWDIAAEELGPYATDLEIDRRWRAWHQANIQTIGDDPHVLLPGTVLTAPDWS